MNMNVNQQPNKISDFDLMTELNACCKQAAAQLTSAILEASHPEVRQALITALQQTFQQQQQLSQLMVQKGYYQPLPASQQMIQQAQSQIGMANAQVGGPAAPGRTQYVQPNLTPPLTGVGPIPPQV
jgi:spore coat protein CotF